MKNSTSVTVSAPGKLLLMGEHAVVYGYPSIVTAINERIEVTVSQTQNTDFCITAPEVNVAHYKKPMSEVGLGDIPKEVKFVEISVRNFLQNHPTSGGIRVETRADFPSTYGFGSSSAVVVSVLFGLFELFHIEMAQKELFDIAYKTVLDVQGKGSGFDVAAAVYGGTLYFVGGGEVIEPMPVATMPLVVGYTGIKADTTALITAVSQKREAYPEKVTRIFEAIEKLTVEAKNRIKEADWARVGTLMNFNQDYLRDLGVSSEPLESLISAAKKAGAWGAKLSGAGGGDCMVALVSDEHRKAVETAIQSAGGIVLSVTPNAPGVSLVTTDPQDEMLIVVNEDDSVIGYKTRQECHRDKSLIHRTVGVLLTNSAGQVLLQKRSNSKDMEPNVWGISAAGHVTRGQTDEEAIRREMQEELGVSVPVMFVGKKIIESQKETERAALYKGTCEGPFYPNEEEVEEVRFFEVADVRKRVAGHEIILTQAAYIALQTMGVLV